jgi:hypothetical protein
MKVKISDERGGEEIFKESKRDGMKEEDGVG